MVDSQPSRGSGDAAESGIYAVVTGGGTAGHVLPALAVADALTSDGRDPREILYVGCTRGIETRLVPETPYRYEFVDVVGFQRSLSRRNLAFIPRMVRAVRQVTKMFRAERPKVVVSVGGYASMPAVFAAKRLKIPIVVISFDRRPGRASSLSARFAAASAVAFPQSPLPRAVLTGAPVRREIASIDRVSDRAKARRALGVDDDRFLIAVMGGSQGSAALNRAVNALVAQHRQDHSLAVRHVVGDRFIDGAAPPLDGSDGIVYQPIGYESDMAAVYAGADLLIGRGGASTVHEVSATGIPAILVPWPDAAEDHQTGNVEWLADVDGAILLPESRIDELDTIVDGLRTSPDRLAELGANALTRGEAQRSGRLAGLIEDVAAGEAPPEGKTADVGSAN